MDDQPALVAAKEVSTHLLYLGVGVFALVGGYLSASKPQHGKWWLLASLGGFGISLLAGMACLMRIVVMIDELKPGGKADIYDSHLMTYSGVQVWSAVIAAILFFIYLVANLRK